MENLQGFNLQEVVEALASLISGWGLRVLGALVVLIIGKMIAGAFRSWSSRAVHRTKLEPTLVPFVSNFVYYLVLTFVVIAVLGIFGIPTASLIAVLGAAGLAVGLALQGTLSNFAAGVMLLVFRPFRVGDYVDAGGTAGSVVSVGVFSTTLNTPDNVQIIVPNSAVYGETIKNFSANDTRRNDLVVGISYSDDIGKALATVKKVLESDPRVLKEPAPAVAVSELADSSVNLVVRPWCGKDDYWPLRFDLMRRLKKELEQAGCSIPFPQTDVHLFKSEPAT